MDERIHALKWSPSSIKKRSARLKSLRWRDYTSNYEPSRRTYRVWRGMTLEQSQDTVKNWEGFEAHAQAELRKLRLERKFHWPDRYAELLFQKQAKLASIQNELKVMRHVLAFSQNMQVFGA